VIHLFLFTIPFPANIGNFIQKLKPIASFNILKVVSKYTVKYLAIDTAAQSELRPNIILPAQDLGITQHNSITNLGNVFHLEAFYFWTVAKLVFYAVSSMFGKDSHVSTVVSLKNKVFFGQLLGLLVGGFIPISIAVFF